MPHTSQLQRIQTKLQAARQTDTGFQRFGAIQHWYALGDPLDEAAIADFEAANGIQLPEPYRAFLSHIGNGGPNGQDGAGPYSGVSALGQGFQYMYRSDPDDHETRITQRMGRPCLLNPASTEAEWYDRVRFFEEDDYDTPEFWENYYSLFDGLLPLGTEAQRGTYVMMLVLNGDHTGRIVIMDMELQKPMFHVDAHFLDWYEHWLDELLAGFSAEKFGYEIVGDPEALLARIAESDDLDFKRRVLRGLKQSRSISETAMVRLKGFCLHDEVPIRHAAISALLHFDRAQARPFLREIFSLTDADRSFALDEIGKEAPEQLKGWADVILENLGRIQDRLVFAVANSILNRSGVDFGDALLPYLKHPNEDFQVSALEFLGVIPTKERYLGVFKEALENDSMRHVRTALYCLKGMNHEELLPLYETILYKFPYNQYLIGDLFDRLRDLGAPARAVVEKAAMDANAEIAKRAQKVLEGWNA